MYLCVQLCVLGQRVDVCMYVCMCVGMYNYVCMHFAMQISM